MPISGGSISMPSYGGDKKRVAKRKAKRAAKAAKGDSSLYNIAGKPKRRMAIKDDAGKKVAVIKRGKAKKSPSGKTGYTYTTVKKKK